MIILDNKRYGERGKEFKVLYHASAAAIYDRNLRQSAGNPWQIAGTILSRKYSLLIVSYNNTRLKRKKLILKRIIKFLSTSKGSTYKIIKIFRRGL
jgi:hypothetical protein